MKPCLDCGKWICYSQGTIKVRGGHVGMPCIKIRLVESSTRNLPEAEVTEIEASGTELKFNKLVVT